MNFNRLGLVIGSLLLSTSGFAAQYIMKLKNDAFMSYAFNVQGSQQAFRILDTHEQGQLLKIDIADAKTSAVLADLLKRPEVVYVVQDFKLKALSTPVTIEALREQWALTKVQAEKAWTLAGNKGKRTVTVAVIDTGVDYNHESLKTNSVPGYNFINNNEDPMDKTGAQNPGHGTHCAGIVGATGQIDNGIQGLSPDVSLMALRFLDERGSGDLMNGIKAIDFAISKKVDVISASWGAAVSASQAQPLIEAVKRASDAGVIFVAAAANDGKNNDSVSMYPANANFENTITVAASGSADEKPSWSNFGKAKVHVAAPGLNIMSTLPKNAYGNLSGTSMATPLVSGLVALLKAQDPTLTGAKVKALMQVTGTKVAIETACNCRIDAGNAMEALLNKTPYIAPAAGSFNVGESTKLSMINNQGTVSFVSSNPAVATVDAEGILKAIAKGETTVTANDAKGTAKSLTYYVNEAGQQPPPGGGGDCPLGNPALCEALCGIMPTLPFCSQ